MSTGRQMPAALAHSGAAQLDNELVGQSTFRSRWRDPMIIVREASAAVVLVVTLTLLLQCAGMAALTSLPARIADSVVGGILSLAVFPIMGICFYFSTSSYATGRLRRCRSSVDVAAFGSGGK